MEATQELLTSKDRHIFVLSSAGQHCPALWAYRMLSSMRLLHIAMYRTQPAASAR